MSVLIFLLIAVPLYITIGGATYEALKLAEAFKGDTTPESGYITAGIAWPLTWAIMLANLSSWPGRLLVQYLYRRFSHDERDQS